MKRVVTARDPAGRRLGHFPNQALLCLVFLSVPFSPFLFGPRAHKLRKRLSTPHTCQSRRMPRTRQHPLIKQTSYDSGFRNSTVRIWCCRGVIIGQVGRASREQRICSEKNVKKWRLAGPQPQQREICSRYKIQGDLQRTRHKTKQAQLGGGRKQGVS